MKNYYSTSLHTDKLLKCYQVAPKRVQQYLDAELQFVIDKIDQNDIVLDLGCGYGRVSAKIAQKAKMMVGIDRAEDNIQFAKEFVKDVENCEFHVMNANNLKFADKTFDLVFCIQNGISAFKISPVELIQESIRVTKPGGRLLLSTYSDKFWNDRLDWFMIQSEHGLIGEIDFNKTEYGTIVCKDGFKATTYSENNFIDSADTFDLEAQVTEIDKSSLFCEMIVS